MAKAAVLILGLSAALLSGCAGPEVDPIARLRTSAEHKFEIELRANVPSYGGPCSVTCIPTWIEESHWIYTNDLAGTVGADRIVLTYERGKLKYPWPQEALRGTLTFTDLELRVDLQVPYFRQDSTISHYTPYRYNGLFKLQQLDR